MRAVEVVGTTVKLRRLQLGLSQATLAEQLAEHGMTIDPTALGRIETGKRDVKVDELLALAAALELTPGELLAPRLQSGDTLTVGAHELDAPQVMAWVCGDREALRRRTRRVDDLHQQVRDQRLLSDLVAELEALADAIDKRDRAAVIWVATRTHATLSELVERSLTDDELRRIWDDYELRED